MDFVVMSTFIKRLSDVLQTSLAKHELIPSKLFDKLKKINTEIGWLPILGWDSFEYGREDWSFDRFLALIQFEKGDELQILSDCSYQKDEISLYKIDNYEGFEDLYFNRYGEDFFQPLDYVVLKNNAEVILIHHEGLIAFYPLKIE